MPVERPLSIDKAHTVPETYRHLALSVTCFGDCGHCKASISEGVIRREIDHWRFQLAAGRGPATPKNLTLFEFAFETAEACLVIRTDTPCRAAS